MIGTAIYNKGGTQIYPITNAEVVTSKASGKEGTVEKNLQELFEAISKLTGDSQVAASVIVDVTYCASKTRLEDEVKRQENWQKSFVLPNSDFPYTWKHTIFTYKGNVSQKLNELYEIVATDTAEKIQNIYIAKSTSSAPVIKYPILTDGESGEPIPGPDGQNQEDLTAFDNKLPEGWSETPMSIGPATPYVFMSTRKKVDGLWKRFSEPAQFGRWAFDSLLELRYATTPSEKPALNDKSEDPGTQWKTESPSEFTGKLWMITATSVNGILNKDENGVIWNGPHLLSIIK